MKTYLHDDKFYNIKKLKPNKKFKIKMQENGYGKKCYQRQKRGKR